jgi:hypothetical protein
VGQLNDLQIKAAEPRDKEYMLADGEGLYLSEARHLKADIAERLEVAGTVSWWSPIDRQLPLQSRRSKPHHQ